MEDKPVGEVIAATTQVKEVLMKTQCRFPRRESTQQWNIQKMHGVFMMGTTQQLQHGNGQGSGGCHIERMHKVFLTVLGRRTQMRPCNFASQVAVRQCENYILDQCISTLNSHLMDLGEEDLTSIDNNTDTHLENAVSRPFNY